MRFKLEILLLILSTILYTLCENSSEPTIYDLQNVPKYDVLIHQQQGIRFTIWVGVIISNRYVLSTDIRNVPVKDLKIIVGYVHIGSLDDNNNYLNKNHFVGHAGEYKVEKYWQFESLSLFKTKTQILFSSKVRSVGLPKGKELNEWKNPHNIPNNKEFTTSYWCRPSAKNDYALQIITRERKCAKDTCFRSLQSVSSCINIKVGDQICRFVHGVPLVFNNTLVGTRGKLQVIKPYGEILEDTFINIAFHVETIEKIIKIMESDYKCYN